MREMLDRCHQARDDQAEVPLELLARADESKHTFRIVLGSIARISLLLGGGLIDVALGLGIPLVVEAFAGMKTIVTPAAPPALSGAPLPARAAGAASSSSRSPARAW